MIDAIHDTIGNIKAGQIAMKEEVKYHNDVLIPDIERGVDKNLTATQKNNARVIKLLNSSSNCSLYIIIAIEVVVLLMQLIILP